MGILKKLSSLLTPQSTIEAFDYWLTVECNRCGEMIRARVDLRNDLSIEYGEGGSDPTYYCRKVIIGQQRCYQPIEVDLVFDKKHRLIDQRISGGKFVQEEG